MYDTTIEPIGMAYDPVQDIFDEAMQREQKIIYSYFDKSEHKCIFRKNRDTNQSGSNNLTIYYPADCCINEGLLLTYGGKVFLTLNQETVENSIYKRSDLLETNSTLETYSNQQEIILPVFSYDLLNTLPQKGNVISMVSGNIELITQDCPASRSITLNSEFEVLGGNYKVVNSYYRSGICHVFVERASDATTPVVHSLSINADATYQVGKSAKLTATAKRDDNIVTNATIQWSSSSPDIVSIGKDGTALFLSSGTAIISALWTEHGITATAIVEVSAEEKKVCTITGRDEIFIGGSARNYTATFYDANGNVDSSIAAVWSLELTEEAQRPYIIMSSPTATSVKVQALANDELVGGTFNLVLRDATGSYHTAKTITCTFI